MTPRTIYLRSYDRYDDILAYRLPEGAVAILTRSGFAALGPALNFGAFCREGERVAGVFASPDGPVFFLDAQHVVGRFGRTSAAVTDGPLPSTQSFTFAHEAVAFTLVYRKRHGIGTNPYDNDEADVDLFAMIASGVRREAFFRGYTRDWVEAV
jgi:hypothetical protein